MHPLSKGYSDAQIVQQPNYDNQTLQRGTVRKPSQVDVSK